MFHLILITVPPDTPTPLIQLNFKNRNPRLSLNLFPKLHALHSYRNFSKSQPMMSDQLYFNI